MVTEMNSSSKPLSATLPPTSYARRGFPSARTLRRWWYVAAGVVFLGALVLIGRSMAGTWLKHLMGRDDGLTTYHVVEPVTLSITLTEDGELKPCESINIKCEVEGQSTILSVVPESTRVKKDDLLVELASDQIQDRLKAKELELDGVQADHDAAVEELAIQTNQNASNLKKAEIDLAVAELDLQKYLEGDFQGRLKEINVQIQQSEMDIERQERELEENRELADKGWVTLNDIQQREFALTVAKMQLERHKLSKKILLDYELPKNEKQKRSDVDRASEELEREKQRGESRQKKSEARVRQYSRQLENIREGVDKLRKQLEKCKIYAPADGVVQYPHENPWGWSSERIAAGEKAYEGQTLVVLPDTSRMLVSTRIHEADRHLVQEGLPCVVTVPAVPGKAFTGKITKIDKYAESESRWLNPDLKEHGAEILLDPVEAPLSPGDSAEAKILIDTLENVLAVPVQCVFTRGARSFVFARRGGTDEMVEVKLGRSNTNLVEVASGLGAGDQVLMKADERLLAMLPTAEAAERAEQQAVVASAEAAQQAPATEAPASAPAVTESTKEGEAQEQSSGTEVSTDDAASADGEASSDDAAPADDAASSDDTASADDGTSADKSES